MNVLLLPVIILLLAAVLFLVCRFRSGASRRLLNDDIANRMPSGLITVSRQGAIVGHNPASERIFEGNLASNSLFRNIVHESDQLQSLLDRCLGKGEVFTRVEFQARLPNSEKKIGINLSPIIDSRGQVEGAICLLSDLTEIVELQRQVKLKENFAALGEMSAGIAHEFKNSIATILGYAQMSTTESERDTLQSYAREIQKESQALSAMITDFLNFARPMNTSIGEADLVELLEGVVADVRNLRPGDYQLQFNARTGATVPCDSTLMRQTFLNLLINAVESLDGPGQIRVLLDRGRERDVNSVQVSIEDTGRGIPSHQLPKIFFPFFTTKTHGTGLGLSLVQKIVIAHNGRIDVQSNVPRGTRFLVTLPLIANHK